MKSPKTLLRQGPVMVCLMAVLMSQTQASPTVPSEVQFTRPGLVLAIALQPDGKVLIGGYFSLVDGVARNNIARLNADGSLDRTWNPGANNAVRQIVLNENDLFVLGDFSAIGGQVRDGIAKLSLVGCGAADPVWNPSHPGNLHALAVDGTNLFAGGLSYLAKFSTSGTGAGESPWGPQPDYNIMALAVQGTDLYVAGNFTQLGGYCRNRLAKISTASGDVDPTWNPSAAGGNLGYITALVCTTSSLYIGGSFDQLASIDRKNIARLSLDGNGAPDSLWNPGTDHEMVYGLAVAGTNVFACGSFSQIGGELRSGVAKLAADGTGAIDPSWQASPDGWVTSLMVSGTSIFIGGNFGTIDGIVSPSLAKLDSSTGAKDGSFQAQVGYPGTASCQLSLSSAEGLRLFGIRGGTYEIEYTKSLDAPSWLPLTNITVSTESVTIQGTAQTREPQCFYRAFLMP